MGEESKMPNTYQIASMEKLLDWLKTCPNETYISSLQGNQLHVKFYIPFCKADDKSGTELAQKDNA